MAIALIKLSDFKFHNKDDVGSIMYIGSSTKYKWMVRKLVKTGKDLEMTYAFIENNSGYESYATAWAARLALVYESIENI